MQSRRALCGGSCQRQAAFPKRLPGTPPASPSGNQSRPHAKLDRRVNPFRFCWRHGCGNQFWKDRRLGRRRNRIQAAFGRRETVNQRPDTPAPRGLSKTAELLFPTSRSRCRSGNSLCRGARRGPSSTASDSRPPVAFSRQTACRISQLRSQGQSPVASRKSLYPRLRVMNRTRQSVCPLLASKEEATAISLPEPLFSATATRSPASKCSEPAPSQRKIGLRCFTDQTKIAMPCSYRILLNGDCGSLRGKWQAFSVGDALPSSDTFIPIEIANASPYDARLRLCATCKKSQTQSSRLAASSRLTFTRLDFFLSWRSSTATPPEARSASKISSKLRAGNGPRLPHLRPAVLEYPHSFAAAELNGILPVKGGFYRWTRAAFGDFWGFQCGWWNWSGTFLLNSLYGVLLMDYLSDYLPWITGYTKWAGACLVLCLLAYLNARQSRLRDGFRSRCCCWC